jgi:hypothetical protein
MWLGLMDLIMLPAQALFVGIQSVSVPRLNQVDRQFNIPE